MKIDWDWKNPPKPRKVWVWLVLRWLKRMFSNTNVPLCESDHYRKDHFDPLATNDPTEEQASLWD